MLTIYQFNLQNKAGHATYLSKYVKTGYLVSIHNHDTTVIYIGGGRRGRVARPDRGVPLACGESLSFSGILIKHVSIYALPEQKVSLIVEELEPPI